MTPVIAVFDDFFPDPARVAKSLRSKSFQAYKSPFDGVEYHGINGDIDEEIKHYVFSRLERTMNRDLSGIIFARIMPEGLKIPHRIHSDRLMGQFSAHVYLSEQWPTGAGTTFWNHETEGSTHANHTNEKLIQTDLEDLTKWKSTVTIQGKFNRLLIHNACLFHSAEPHDGFGADQESRLVLTTFFNVR